MDGFSAHSTAPPEYHQVKWLTDLFVMAMGAGWISHYVLMVYTSVRDRTYCLNIISLCADIAWEFVFCAIYPSANPAEWWVTFIALLVNLFVMYTAAQAVSNEWRHSPLVAQNAPLIFVTILVFCIAQNLAMAAQLGPALAYSWGAITCQMLISVGQVCQLLNRNNTRGASYTLWLTRFLGSTSTVGFAALRYLYWPEVFSWLGEPLVLWSLSVFFTAEVSYGFCLYRVKHQGSARLDSEYKLE